MTYHGAETLHALSLAARPRKKRGKKAWATRVYGNLVHPIPWGMSKGNLDDLHLRTNSLGGVLPHEICTLQGEISANMGLLSHAQGH